MATAPSSKCKRKAQKTEESRKLHCSPLQRGLNREGISSGGCSLLRSARKPGKRRSAHGTTHRNSPRRGSRSRSPGRKGSCCDADSAGETPCSTVQGLSDCGTQGLRSRAQAHAMLRQEFFLGCKMVGSHNREAWFYPWLGHAGYT